MAEEKIEKGIISEEALEEIAGGLKAFGYEIPNDKIKKAAIGAGVTILATGAAAGGYLLGKKHGAKSREKDINDATKKGYQCGILGGSMITDEKGNTKLQYNDGNEEGRNPFIV